MVVAPVRAATENADDDAMPMTDDSLLASASATWLVEQYRRKALSPVEVLAAALARLERWQPVINAFCFVAPERAMADARASEVRWLRGEPAGLVDGVPVSIKDVVLTRGWPTLKGSRTSDAAGPWTDDSPVTRRLREHGAVLIGKTTTSEFGWKATGDSPLTGSTRNPWSPEHTSGGSSAGAAASLAVGIAPLAVGSDGGGSIRIPAAFCGVVGLKPTQGRVPYSPPSAMSLLGHCGPMARSVEDVALMLQVIGQPDVEDPYHLPAAACNGRMARREGLTGVRVAFCAELDGLRVDPEIAAAVAAAVGRMRDLGARVDTIASPFVQPHRVFDVLWKAGAANVVASVAQERQPWIDAGLRRAAEEGGRMRAIDYVRADLDRTALGRTMGLFHQSYDLLVTPSVGVGALPVGAELADPERERDWQDWAGFSYPFNITRQPALSVPCGFTRAGLPIGLQIVGALYADEEVLAAGAALAGALPRVGLPPLPVRSGGRSSRAAGDSGA